jgi:hypothetical protein
MNEAFKMSTNNYGKFLYANNYGSSDETNYFNAFVQQKQKVKEELLSHIKIISKELLTN